MQSRTPLTVPAPSCQVGHTLRGAHEGGGNVSLSLVCGSGLQPREGDVCDGRSPEEQSREASCEMGGTAFGPCPCCSAAVIALVAGGAGFTATIQSQDGSMTATIRDDRWAPCRVIHVGPKLA